MHQSFGIYSGGDSGFEERDGVLDYLKGLDSKKYLVVLFPVIIIDRIIRRFL